MPQALVWNVFRTLELLTPALWMRLLHARLLGEALTPAPQIVRISLWRSLAVPPMQRLDGHRPDVVADVIVETEHAVWTLVCTGDDDWEDIDSRVSGIIEAGAWYAGARRHYSGVIDASARHPSLGDVLKARFSRTRDSASLRISSPGMVAARVIMIGATRWPDLAAVLDECANAESLPHIERALARNATSWLERVGMTPAG